MVAALRELYAKSKHPSHDDQESASQALGHIIEQAQALGRSHAAEHVGQRSVAWGGNFVNALQSGWDIVTKFVSKISGWIADQISGGNDPTPEEIQAEIDTVAGNVGDFEVHAAIESEVLRELTFADVKMVRSVAQPGACQLCLDKAADGPVPINDFTPPPYHGSCRCNAMPADDERVMRTEAPEPRLISQKGTCDCEICLGMAGKPVGERKPPYHTGCSCSTREVSEEDQ